MCYPYLPAPDWYDPALGIDGSIRAAYRPKDKPSPVDPPAHYDTGKIEVIAAIEDLEKARWYLDREIGRLKSKLSTLRDQAARDRQ